VYFSAAARPDADENPFDRNPSAGAGQAKRRVPRVLEAFERAGVRCEVAETSRPGQATELARAAADIDVLAIMGGDGTLNEVSRAFIDDHGNPVDGPELGLIPCGTGGDFRRSFDVGPDLAHAVQRVVAGRPRAVDLGLARCGATPSALSTFGNVGSLGISGVVTRLVNSSSKWLGGKATFYLASARATLGYRNVSIQLRADGKLVHDGPTYLAAFANGRYFGGGMRIAPAADPSDGLLDCVVLGDLSVPQAFALTSKIYAGTHLNVARAKTQRGRHFEATPWPAPADGWVELDGEVAGKLPLVVDVLPRAIRVRC